MSKYTVVKATMWIAAACVIGRASVANGAEIKVLGTQSVQIIWNDVGPIFERRTGHKVTLTPNLATATKKLIDAGETFDVAIATPPVIDQLIKEGKIIAATRTDIVRQGIGVAVRAGAPKPDIGTTDAVKRALLNAKSVAYLKTGATGQYMAQLVKRLGIAEQLQAKTLLPETDIVGPMVARGEAELGLAGVATLIATPCVDVVGPLPADIQFYGIFSGGIGAGSKSVEASKECIRFLTGATAIPVIKAKGMEPG